MKFLGNIFAFLWNVLQPAIIMGAVGALVGGAAITFGLPLIAGVGSSTFLLGLFAAGGALYGVAKNVSEMHSSGGGNKGGHSDDDVKKLLEKQKTQLQTEHDAKLKNELKNNDNQEKPGVDNTSDKKDESKKEEVKDIPEETSKNDNSTDEVVLEEPEQPEPDLDVDDKGIKLKGSNLDYTPEEEKDAYKDKTVIEKAISEEDAYKEKALRDFKDAEKQVENVEGNLTSKSNPVKSAEVLKSAEENLQDKLQELSLRDLIMENKDIKNRNKVFEAFEGLIKRAKKEEIVKEEKETLIETCFLDHDDRILLNKAFDKEVESAKTTLRTMNNLNKLSGAEPGSRAEDPVKVAPEEVDRTLKSPEPGSAPESKL